MVNYVNITAMLHYINKSVEELRWVVLRVLWGVLAKHGYCTFLSGLAAFLLSHA